MRIFILFFLVLYSCKSQCPDINTELVNTFNYNLKIIENHQNHQSVNVEQYRKALLFLSTTTGIMTKADYSSTLGYTNQKEYVEDMELWKEWLEKNKCKSNSLNINTSR